MKCIYDPTECVQWDNNLEDAYNIPIHEGKFSYTKSYSKNKKQFGIAARDFYDKGFLFIEKGVVYRYTCSHNNHKELPNSKGVIRGETLYNFARISRDPLDRTIRLVCLTQCDFKLSVPGWAYTTFLPKAFKSWVSDVQTHYQKNAKNL